MFNWSAGAAVVEVLFYELLNLGPEVFMGDQFERFGIAQVPCQAEVMVSLHDF